LRRSEYGRSAPFETVCDAATGIETARMCPLGCNADGAACARLIPANVGALDPATSIGSRTYTGEQTYDTTVCDSGEPLPQVSGGPEVCVLHVDRFTLASGAGLRVIGVRPLVIVAEDAVVIDGVLDASAVGTTPGASGGRGGTAASPSLGEFGGGGGNASGAFRDGGGGGGGACGSGGNGGRGGAVTGGFGGAAHPADHVLEPLTGGSGGGFARGAGARSGFGGAGGGAVQISSAVSITVRGAVLAGGGGGNGGLDNPTNYGGGGGGGSGGSVLLEAPVLDFGPDATVWTSGGGGGGSGSIEGAGRSGTDGRTTGLRASGGTSGGAMYGAAGGGGGGGVTPAGAVGSSNPEATGGNGGGGGGGVGCVVLRNRGGVAPSSGSFSGSESPAFQVLSVRSE
jgi:hypothetical protein